MWMLWKSNKYQNNSKNSPVCIIFRLGASRPSPLFAHVGVLPSLNNAESILLSDQQIVVNLLCCRSILFLCVLQRDSEKEKNRSQDQAQKNNI